MIPDYQSLMRPVLALSAEKETRIGDAIERLAIECNLSDEDRSELLPSGKQTVFANRVHWAKTYLKQAGLVRATRRGHFEITQRGREVLADPKATLNTAYLDRYKEFQEFKSRRRPADETAVGETEPNDDGVSSGSTPDERLRAAFKSINDALAADLLDRMRAASPAFFEKLIVELFISMGYGGSADDAGRAIGRSGDDGVDGVIDQDILGVDQVYLQAKRYDEGNNVGASAIRDFFGALSLKKAQKGVFVTTSDFSQSARDTASGLGSRIVLINGKELSRLALRYNLGCRPESTLELKKLDEEFFDEAG